MKYQYSGRQEYPSRLVPGEKARALVSEARSRLRVLILGKESGSDNLCDILAANVQRWGYEAVIVTAAMRPHPQNWQGLEGDILLYDMDAWFQDVEGLGNLSAEAVSQPGLDGCALKPDWPGARLTMILSSSSISRPMLERLGAIALLHKPFDMRILKRYLRVFQRLLYSEVRPDEINELPRLASLGRLTKSQEESAGASQVVRVLVADDHEDVTWGIRQCLIEQENQRYLYEVKEVHEGLALLEQCVAWQPHCVVTDVLMPWLNGYQVMHCLASVTNRPKPMFVIISALMQREIPVDLSSFQDQVVRYVDKPFDVEDLLRVIEQGLAR